MAAESLHALAGRGLGMIPVDHVCPFSTHTEGVPRKEDAFGVFNGDDHDP